MRCRRPGGSDSTAAAPISGWAAATRPPVSTTAPASTAASRAAAGFPTRWPSTAIASGTAIRPAAATTDSASAAGWVSEEASRRVGVSASWGTGVSAAARLAATWMAQNGFPRDWAAASRACAAVTVGGSRPWICA
jgi:hypothetical protein